LRPVKRFEDGVAFGAIVGEDFRGRWPVCRRRKRAVRHRVRARPSRCRRAFLSPHFPFFFAGDFVRIRAAVDDTRDAVAEFFADFIEGAGGRPGLPRPSWQQRGDDFIFAAAVFE